MREIDPDTVLTIDPARQFGQVCIYGTRTPVTSIAGAIAAGDSVDKTAEDYDITRTQALLACWYYVDYCRGSKRLFDKAVVRAWSKWREKAQGILAGYQHYEGQVLEDPPKIRK